jgi:cytochrome c nitrite reductase small subunit
MNQHYDAWLKSATATATWWSVTCSRGHLEVAGKVDHGFRHSAAFTLQDFKEPIEITRRDRDIVRINCVRCHEAFVHAVYVSPRREELDCLRCHAAAGHGAGG